MEYKQSKFNLLIENSNDKVLIFNTLFGSVCRLEVSVWETIQKESFGEDVPYFDPLLTQGYIVPITYDETNKILVNEKIAKYQNNTSKLSFVIAPTMQCNLRCYYCFESLQSDCAKMTEGTENDVIKYIENKIKAETKKIHIGWFGGEPLLACDLIVRFSEKIINICNENGVEYSASMISNGILLNDEKILILKDKCKVERIQITLDGTEKEYCRRKRATKEQYYKVLDNIEKCSDSFKVIVRLNCDKQNYEDLLAVTKELLDNRGLSSKIKVYLAPITDYKEEGFSSCGYNEVDKFIIDFDNFIKENFPSHNHKIEMPKARPVFCGLKCINNMAIGPNGELYKCEHDFGNADKVVGDVKNGLYYNQFFEDFMKLELSDKCKDCKLLPICLGGCPTMRYDLKKENCIMTEELVKYIIKVITKSKEAKKC